MVEVLPYREHPHWAYPVASIPAVPTLFIVPPYGWVGCRELSLPGARYEKAVQPHRNRRRLRCATDSLSTKMRGEPAANIRIIPQVATSTTGRHVAKVVALLELFRDVLKSVHDSRVWVGRSRSPLNQEIHILVIGFRVDLGVDNTCGFHHIGDILTCRKKHAVKGEIDALGPEKVLKDGPRGRGVRVHRTRRDDVVSGHTGRLL